MIVADTHVLIWAALDPHRLSATARREFEREAKDGGLLACEISLWEIATLQKRGRIEPGTTYSEFIDLLTSAFLLRFTGFGKEAAALAAGFPAAMPGDPADRIIAATALSLGLPLLTADHRIRRAGVVKTVW